MMLSRAAAHRTSLNVDVGAEGPADSDHAEKEEHDAMRMDEVNIHDYARQLLEARGDKLLRPLKRLVPSKSRVKTSKPKLGGISKRRSS